MDFSSSARAKSENEMFEKGSSWAALGKTSCRHICETFCRYRKRDLLVHIAVLREFFPPHWFRCETLILFLCSSWSIWTQKAAQEKSTKNIRTKAAFFQAEKQCGDIVFQELFKCCSYLSAVTWEEKGREGEGCAGIVRVFPGCWNRSVKGASVAWTALHRKPIVGYEGETREQTGSELRRKPADTRNPYLCTKPPFPATATSPLWQRCFGSCIRCLWPHRCGNLQVTSATSRVDLLNWLNSKMTFVMASSLFLCNRSNL